MINNVDINHKIWLPSARKPCITNERRPIVNKLTDVNKTRQTVVFLEYFFLYKKNFSTEIKTPKIRK